MDPTAADESGELPGEAARQLQQQPGSRQLRVKGSEDGVAEGAAKPGPLVRGHPPGVPLS